MTYPFSEEVRKLNPELDGAFLPANKYHVSKKDARTYNGVVYHSKREAEFAQELDLRIKAGEIDFYLRQVRFPLPGKTEYRLDFMTFAKSPQGLPSVWLIEYIEVKGMKIRLGEIKRKQTSELYKIDIDVV